MDAALAVDVATAEDAAFVLVILDRVVAAFLVLVAATLVCSVVSVELPALLVDALALAAALVTEELGDDTDVWAVLTAVAELLAEDTE